MTNINNCIDRYIGLGGYSIFKAKYVESQFGQSSSNATFFTGTTAILPMAIGIILGGVIISVFKPRPKYLVIYIFIVGLFPSMGILTGMFISCPKLNIANNGL